VEGLINEISLKCNKNSQSTCKISLKEVTKFPWDKVYIFTDWTASDSISKTIGIVYQGSDVPDDNSRILFIQNQDVVHEEDFKSLDYRHSTIEFTKLRNGIFFTPSNATFLVKMGKNENTCETCYVYTLIRSNE
jgi:hypothetical protein